MDDAEWVIVTSCENLAGHPGPLAALRAWLRERGIDWMPFVADEVRYDLSCGPGADGHWRGWFTVYAAADALRRLGLHPEQPGVRNDDFSPPAWWHAAGERYGRRWPAPPD